MSDEVATSGPPPAKRTRTAESAEEKTARRRAAKAKKRELTAKGILKTSFKRSAADAAPSTVEVPPDWKEPGPLSKDENPFGMIVETSFATIFPKYREPYIRECFPLVKKCLHEMGIATFLDLVEGSLTVTTTRKAYDPMSILNGRDLIKLLARGVSFPAAKRVLEEGMACDVIRIRGMVVKKERFARRRQRIIGNKGSTLKAIELLTRCYVMVQGGTVAVVGPHRGLAEVRKVVEDAMNNVHPIYNIKRLMIKRELEKDPALKDQDWERFMPKFKKKNAKTPKPLKKKTTTPGKAKPYTPFPPPPVMSRVDKELETGEYFLKEEERKLKKELSRLEKNKKAEVVRREKRKEAFVEPKEDENRRKTTTTTTSAVDVEKLKKKLKKRKKKSVT